MSYWIRYKNGEKEPFTKGQIQEELRRGRLQPDTLCAKTTPAEDLFSSAKIKFVSIRNYPEFHDSCGLPESSANQEEVTESIGSDFGSSKFRLICSPVGLAAGLVVSYFLAPGYVRMMASFDQWLFEGFEEGFGGTIISCGIVGSALGFGIGVYLDARARKK